MSPREIFSLRSPVLSDNGAPLGGGSIDVFATGTTTRVTSYTDSTRTVLNANPILVPASGRVSAWVDVDVDVRVTDVNGRLLYTETGLNPAFADESTGLIVNGNFETEEPGSSGRLPLQWEESDTGADSDNSRDSTTVFSGTRSWRFQSTGTDGGGILTQADVFLVNDFEPLIIEFYLRASSGTVSASATVLWFDAGGSSLTSTVLFENLTGNPTSFTKFIFTPTGPTGAAQAKIQIRGAYQASAGSVYFDQVSARFGSIPVPTLGQPFAISDVTGTSSLTLTETSLDRIYLITSGTTTINVNTGLFVAGQSFWAISQGGTTLTMSYGAGVTVNGSAGAGSIAIASGQSQIWICLGSNTWVQREIEAGL